METWTEVDIEVDERLACRSDAPTIPLGCDLTKDNELWPCYLEKAVAAHCGGWDQIDGGQCTHAWMLLTGCREQYVIQRSEKGGRFGCFGGFNPQEHRWEPMANSPHEGFQGMWPMEWPDEGGGGEELGTELDDEALFVRMCAWDDANYIIGASTEEARGEPGAYAGAREGSTPSIDGIQIGHAYSLLEVVNDAAGTDVDLIKMRNPHGRGELTAGQWADDDGPGWKQYPQIKALLNPVKADDGIFWVSKAEFFQYFDVVYLCAQDMSEFIAPEQDAIHAQRAAARGRRGAVM